MEFLFLVALSFAQLLGVLLGGFGSFDHHFESFEGVEGRIETRREM